MAYSGVMRTAYVGSRGKTVEGGGVKWGSGLENISVTALLADPQDHQKLYAGTADHGIYASRDGGQTWQSIGPADLTTASSNP
jgi:hypothetical protein